MQEKITKFDLEAAFKALDEIEIPKVAGVIPNRINLVETVRPSDRTSLLIEDYFDVGDSADLEAATKSRDADIAQAKLARIEKIVDLNAESPDELLPSYAGKTIIQCPQCMNIFFKEPADIEGSEGGIDTIKIGDTVNAGEACQHCGNDDGYIFGGWVKAEDNNSAEELPAADLADEEAATELEPIDIPEEIPTEEDDTAIDTEEAEPEAEEEINLDEIPDESEEEKKEESFKPQAATSLQEQVEEAAEEEANCKEECCDCEESCKEELIEAVTELDKKLEEHNEYIDVLQAEIEKEEKAISEAKNEFIKKMHEGNLESLKAALDKAIPEEVKSEVEELPEADEIPEEAIEEPQELTEALNKEDEISDNEYLRSAKSHANRIFGYGKGNLLSLDKVIDEWNSFNFDKHKPDDEAEQIIYDAMINRFEQDGILEKVTEIKGLKESYFKLNYYGGKNIKLFDYNEVINTCLLAAGYEDPNGDLNLVHEYDDNGKILRTIWSDEEGFIDVNPEDEYLKEELTQEEQDRFDEISKDGIIRQKDRYEFQQLLRKSLEKPEADKKDELTEAGIDTRKAVIREIENDPEAQAYLEKELRTPISAAEVEASLSESIAEADDAEEFADGQELVEQSDKTVVDLDKIEDFDETAFDDQITECLTNIYENVADFKTSGCSIDDKNLIVEGKINFKSGKTKDTKFVFSNPYVTTENTLKLTGFNESLTTAKNSFMLRGTIEKDKLLTESIDYKYFINNSLVRGTTKK